MFFEILSILAPIFVCTVIGFGWARSGKRYDTPLVTSLVTYFGTPCLVFSTLATVELDKHALWQMGGAALIANLVFLAVGWAALKLAKLPPQAFLMALSWPNVGNIGLPLCLLAFGDEGLALAIVFFAVYVVFQMTVGIAIVAGTFSLKSVLHMPIIPATLAAAVFLATGTAVPEWLFNTTDLIGQLTIPLMLITLGVSLASLHVGNLPQSLWLAGLRFAMGIATGFGLIAAFGLENEAAGVVLLECAMPSAVFAYLFAQHYDQRPEEVAGLVVTSTTLAIPLLPALLWYAL